MNLTTAVEGKEYIIQAIEADDEEMEAFLFSLGCYSADHGRVPAQERLRGVHQGRPVQH